MTSGDLTMEEARSLQRIPKPRPGPVRDIGHLVLLLELAGMFCSGSLKYESRRPFFATTAELLAEASSVLAPGQILAQGDIEIVLPGMSWCFRRVKGGWQWR
jgi:hypothetical protein